MGLGPATLKGFLDRVLASGWAYREDPLPRPLRALGNHAAQVIGAHTLGFCGIEPLRVTRFGGVRWSTPEQRRRWLHKASDLAARDAA